MNRLFPAAGPAEHIGPVGPNIVPTNSLAGRKVHKYRFLERIQVVLKLCIVIDLPLFFIVLEVTGPNHL